MHAWLKRAVAGLLSAGTLLGGGLLTAGTANADEIRMPDIGKTITSLTASAATTYPRELVNGGFDYLPDGGWKTVDAPSYMTNAYTSVDPNNGQYMRNAKHSDADLASWAAGDEMAVNGGFDTPKWTIAKEGQGLPWVYVTPNKGMIRSYAQAMAGQTGVKAGGLTAATFAWQDVDATGGIQNFELHREKDGNTAADVHAGRTVAQTVNTTPGASYTFSIRHSGRSKGNAGGVTLLTGPDKDHLTPVKLTRTTVSKTGQKYGDKTGDVGTVAYTHSDSMDATEGSHEPWDHSDDWESYEGTVIIPAGQSRTMIAYRGVAKDGTLTASANDSIIDDLSFRLAYKLNDAQNTIKRLQNAEENLKKANAKLTEAQSKLDEANKAKDEADKAYEKAKADYDAKLADKQASDKELAAAKQAEAEARKKAEEEAKKQQEAQKKADQAKKDAEAKKQKAEQAKKQAAGVTNNGLASTGSDTTAIATLAAIMTIAGAGCVLVKVRSAKHADGWHAVED